MDFRIKIDLSSQSIIENTPSKEIKKKKGEILKKINDSDIKTPQTSKRRKQVKKRENSNTEPKEPEKQKLNPAAILSLSFPNNENIKTDQAQKISLINKKKPRHWEKRWVLIPNVFEFTKEIWLKKWVLVDGGEDISDNNVILF